MTVIILVLILIILMMSTLVVQVMAIAIPVLPYSIEECHDVNIKSIFVVYINIINAPSNGLLRIGIPGELGYKCQFHDQTVLQYGFKEGEIKLHDEFYACIDDRDTGNLNCEVHRYLNKKNPETIDLTMKTLVPSK